MTATAATNSEVVWIFHGYIGFLILSHDLIVLYFSIKTFARPHIDNILAKIDGEVQTNAKNQYLLFELFAEPRVHCLDTS